MKSLLPTALLFAVSGTACTALQQTTESPVLTAPAPVADSTGLSAVSNADFATTEARLLSALASRGLNLFTIVDHQAGAGSVELNLGANKVFVFGNPKAGTLLMQTNPAIGRDLPLKAAIYEHDGEIMVSVSDIRAITATHGIIEPPQVIANIERALASILSETVSGQ